MQYFYVIPCEPTSKERPISVGKAFTMRLMFTSWAFNVSLQILRVICWVKWNTSTHTNGWLISSPQRERCIFSGYVTKFTESCLTRVVHAKVGLWNQRLGHLSAASKARMKKEYMVIGTTFPKMWVVMVYVNQGNKVQVHSSQLVMHAQHHLKLCILHWWVLCNVKVQMGNPMH